ncbi:MAG TPA: recombinase family protein [Candidatus Omnitrophota bacterium]|nr:recombinase family protein [Candidatus Omnitrophota bacterium]
MTVKNGSVSVALYARVSTEEQKENFSLAAQSELLRKHAAEKNYVVYEEYVDGGYSGTTMERPAFKKLLADAAKKKFQLVLVYKLDRFFRNNRALLTVSEELEKSGIGIKSITEPFDTSNHLGKFILSLFGSLAQLERDTFMERSKMGRMRRAKEGYYSGSNPTKYGYVYNPQTRKLDIHEKEAEGVRMAFKLYNEPDSSLLKVAKRLTELGYKTKLGKDFTTDVVHDIVTSSIYMGKWYANKYGHNGKLKPRDEWIEVAMPALINEKTFNVAQQLLNKRRNYTVRNVKYQYLLQGLIKCGDCGNSVSGTADRQTTIKNGKKYGPYFKLYYRCTHFVKNLYRKTVSCKLRYIQAEKLEPLVWEQIERFLSDPSVVEKTIAYENGGSAVQQRQLTKELDRVNDKIESMGSEEQRIIEAYRHKVLTLEQLNKEISKIKGERTLLEKRQSDLEDLLSVERAKPDLKEVAQYIETVKEGLKKFTHETKKNALAAFKTRIVANVNGVIDIFLSIPKNLSGASSSNANPHIFSWSPLQQNICSL